MSNQFNDTDIAIVGMACRFPGAKDIGQFWKNLRDGVESITFFDADELAPVVDAAELRDPGYVRAASTIDDVELFDAAFFGFSPREAEIMDPQHRMMLECAWEALEHAGYDSDTYRGVIGAYLGASTNTYLLLHLLQNVDIVRNVDPLQINFGNTVDYMTTRVSYLLNLQGPSVTVQTACSTSLVAVHMACRSILAGECDMALAGGASANLKQRYGYRYQPDGIYTPDGHCRAFDAQGQGTIFGSGVGIVLLKRLEDALADGDTLHAVIKGSAVNNDGAGKVSYTAPSGQGQTRVIIEALAMAGVEADTIGYVEAHGTGTALGDPIEVMALTQAFRRSTAHRRFCALGSVKTNFGHLDAAAGVAGLLKTVLALDHAQIPPSLHFQTPNPHIDFASSPFYVNTALAPWPTAGPRRAGVSSFGIGGTNAHVVLEQAPPQPAGAPSRPWQLLLLSAKTSAALKSARAGLATFLQQHPDLDLADVAYTLQVGRRALGQRCTLVCRDREEAIAALEANSPPRLLTQGGKRDNPSVIFLFPGQGTQYVRMAAGLYQTEPTFRAEIDRCAELLAPHLGLDIREVIYPDSTNDERRTTNGGPPTTDHRPPTTDRQGDTGTRRQGEGEAETQHSTLNTQNFSSTLDQTALAQPALFVVEYALARLWMVWGIQPEAMIGHSIGEYVAACLAGTFSLEDALALVAARGRLMGELPAGAMLAVPLPEAEIHPLLGATLSLAASNGPQLSVVSGPIEAVTSFEQQLTTQGIECRRLHTSHAFHSSMMDPILERFTRSVRDIALQPPAIPYISNVSGTWITAEQACDPSYWAQHLRQPVRFAEGIQTLLRETEPILLEVGPARTLSTLVRQHPDFHDQIVLSSLPHPRDRQDDTAALLHTLGRLWLARVPIEWAAFSAHERRRRVPVPTYPFERRRYWIDATPQAARPAPPVADAAGGLQERVARDMPADVCAPEASTAAGWQRLGLSSAYEAPRDTVEQALAAIWQGLLGVTPIGIHDNFFELGGHSLLAMQLIGLVRDSLGAEISMRTLFEAPSVAEMATVLSARQNGQAGSADRARVDLPQIVADLALRHQPFPLTDVQQAYWIGRQGAFELGNVSTHGYLELDSDEVDVGRAEQSWQQLIARHDALQTIVLPSGQQQILEHVPPYQLLVHDLRGQEPAAIETQLAATRERMSHQVLPSDRWPLFEVRATRIDDRRTRFHISIDLLIADAWSFDILLREFYQLYYHPQTELPPLEISFRDYVLAEIAFRETATYQRAQEYWRGCMLSLPSAPELPLARNPAALARPRFVRRRARLDVEAWQRLKSRGGRAHLTPSGVLLAAFAEVLTVWSKSPRFTINLTLFHRLPIHAQVNDILGDFSSLILLAVDNSAVEPFEARAMRLQQQLLESLDYRYVSGVAVQRELARSRGGQAQALMPVVFTSLLIQSPHTQDAVRLEDLGSEVYSISQTPQVWLDHQVFEEAGALCFNWDAVEELFPEGLLQAMFDAYTGLLRRLADQEACWQSTERRLMPADQLAQRAAINATSAAMPTGLLHSAFVEQAHQRPTQPAVITAGKTLTYTDLQKRSVQIGRWLRQMQARPNTLVAVVMEKGWEQIVAVLGILQAGAAYVPIDAGLPQERLESLLAQSQARLVLTQSWVDARQDWPAEARRLCVDTADLEAFDDRPLEPTQTPADLAYVIFTSGSTGQPKGVMIDHRGALNTIADINQRFAIGPDDRVLALSSLSFDLSVYDIFGTLAAGGALVVPDAAARRDPAHWAALVDGEQITIWNTVPALMEMLVEYQSGRPSNGLRSLRLVMLSGDWIPLALPEQIRALVPGAQVVSLGGATEASIWSILYPIGQIDPAWKSIPYGRPMINQTFHVLNEVLEPCPVWVVGQLYIGGVGLAQGYWRDTAKTAERFVPNPFADCRLQIADCRLGDDDSAIYNLQSTIYNSDRLYKTGDLGRYRHDGSIEFLGREDFQVKIQGYRIELGEIEAALSQHPQVRAAVVTAMGEARDKKRLVAYVVPTNDQRPTTNEEIDSSFVVRRSSFVDELHAFLQAKLPAYMVPASVVLLERLPLTSNGKLDRQSLPEPHEPSVPYERAQGAPGTAAAQMIAAIVQEVLQVESASVYDNFFDLGATSVQIVQIHARMREATGYELPLVELFQHPTISTLARHLEAQQGADATIEQVRVQAESRKLARKQRRQIRQLVVEDQEARRGRP